MESDRAGISGMWLKEFGSERYCKRSDFRLPSIFRFRQPYYSIADVIIKILLQSLPIPEVKLQLNKINQA